MYRAVTFAAALALLLTELASAAHQIRVRNWCTEPVYVGVTSNAGAPALISGSEGFLLTPTEARNLTMADNWGGRISGRAGCDANGNGCDTDPSEPATLAELQLDWDSGSGFLDFYDVSLVDGYNLPMHLRPMYDTILGERDVDGRYCAIAGCDYDLLKTCPRELALKTPSGTVVACRSACNAFATDAYCCGGAHSTPETCGPTAYSQTFKAACPRAYSYAFDDQLSTFTCKADAGSVTNYVVTFCPQDGL